jgi:hypothetical protein
MPAASTLIRRARRSTARRLSRFTHARLHVRPARARREGSVVVVARPSRAFGVLFGSGTVRTIGRHGLTEPDGGHLVGWIDSEPEPPFAADAARGVVNPPPDGGRRIARGGPSARRRRDYVAEVREARLIGRAPLALTPRGEIVEEAITWTREDNARIELALASVFRSRGLPTTIREIRRGTGRPDLEKLGCACLLTGPRNRFNYYHWTFEQLPKLRALEEYRQRTGETPVLVVPPDPPNWAIETLRLAGHGETELVEWRDRDAVVEALVVPAHPSPSPAVCEWLRERLRDPLTGPGTYDGRPVPGERILVSRDDSAKDKRSVVNERELAEALGELGFRRHVLGELSVAEQIRLFAGAEAVVSPHGAGLANLVYARRAAVIELFGERLKPTFFRVARLLGHPYRYVLCDSAGSRDSLRADPKTVLQAARESLDALARERTPTLAA